MRHARALQSPETRTLYRGSGVSVVRVHNSRLAFLVGEELNALAVPHGNTLKTSVTLLACLLSACGLPPPADYDCMTETGVYVKGGSCESVALIFSRVDALFEGAPLSGVYVRLVDGGAGAAGHTSCETQTILVDRSKPWALAHEAVHIKQGCPFDEDAYSRCMAATPSPMGCANVAQHVDWNVAVLPLLSTVVTYLP